MFLKFFFPFLFLLQLICTSYVTAIKINSNILSEVSTEELGGDFSSEDGEDVSELYKLENKSGLKVQWLIFPALDRVCFDKYIKTPKSIFLETLYSPPEQII